jgi:protein-L-isoaspartate(D-aspartate) O-methyltransferase
MASGDSDKDLSFFSDETFVQARRRMLEEQLRNRQINDERVLEAMGRIPRERFVLPADTFAAYDDQALPIGSGQTISQPYMVALMTELLEIEPGDRILEIGTGSGYQTAILACLARQVYSVERLPELSEQAGNRLRELGLSNVMLRVGDGTLGWPEEAPFDGVIVTAGAPSVPPALVEQLADRGRLVVPVGGGGYQTLTVIERRGKTTIERPGIACRFVPLIGEAGWDERDEGDKL